MGSTLAWTTLPRMVAPFCKYRFLHRLHRRTNYQIRGATYAFPGNRSLRSRRSPLRDNKGVAFSQGHEGRHRQSSRTCDR